MGLSCPFVIHVLGYEKMGTALRFFRDYIGLYGSSAPSGLIYYPPTSALRAASGRADYPPTFVHAVACEKKRTTTHLPRARPASQPHKSSIYGRIHNRGIKSPIKGRIDRGNEFVGLGFWHIGKLCQNPKPQGSQLLL